MIKLTLDEIIKAVEGECINMGNTCEYTSLSTDSRNINDKSIFIALKGDNFNGNEFVLDAINKGALLCIVDEVLFDADKAKTCTVIKVRDTREALKKLAKYYREKLNIKVVGITGSTGKTTTKDLLAAFLGYKYKVFKTKGNFNNEIGLPLMIFQLDESYDIAVLEMGMNNLNEIHNLADIARPDIALITNIGISHIENLKTRENILRAKMEITDFFTAKNTLIINCENDLLKSINTEKYILVKTGMEENYYDYFARNISLEEDSSKFQIYNNTLEGVLSLPIPGRHNIENALIAFACARLLGVSFNEIQLGIKSLTYTSMRLEINKGSKFTVINDAYNASPDSMRAALDVQCNINGKRKVAILGTMKELGEASYCAHKSVGQYAKEKGIDILIAVGEYNEAFLHGFKDESKCILVETTENVASIIEELIQDEDIVLVKASRSMKFESIITKLQNLNS